MSVLQFQIIPLDCLVSLEFGNPELSRGYKGSAEEGVPLAVETESGQRGLLGATTCLASCAKLTSQNVGFDIMERKSSATAWYR